MSLLMDAKGRERQERRPTRPDPRCLSRRTGETKLSFCYGWQLVASALALNANQGAVISAVLTLLAGKSICRMSREAAESPGGQHL
jgi:hypothetical protein